MTLHFSSANPIPQLAAISLSSATSGKMPRSPPSQFEPHYLPSFMKNATCGAVWRRHNELAAVANGSTGLPQLLDAPDP